MPPPPIPQPRGQPGSPARAPQFWGLGIQKAASEGGSEGNPRPLPPRPARVPVDKGGSAGAVAGLLLGHTCLMDHRDCLPDARGTAATKHRGRRQASWGQRLQALGRNAFIPQDSLPARGLLTAPGSPGHPHLQAWRDSQGQAGVSVLVRQTNV